MNNAALEYIYIYVYIDGCIEILSERAPQLSHKLILVCQLVSQLRASVSVSQITYAVIPFICKIAVNRQVV